MFLCQWLAIQVRSNSNLHTFTVNAAFDNAKPPPLQSRVNKPSSERVRVLSWPNKFIKTYSKRSYTLNIMQRRKLKIALCGGKPRKVNAPKLSE